MIVAGQSGAAARPVVLVAGARPNFMKVAPVMRALEPAAHLFRPVLVHTGQHYDWEMSRVFFEQLGLREPDVSLEVGPGTHASQTAAVLRRFERVLADMRERPAGVVVVGDVNSTVACALAAAKLHVPIAHVEAGLRSFDRRMPEEINRIVTDVLADVLLVSDPSGEAHLRAQGVPAEKIRFVGNVMIDTLVHQFEAAVALDMPARFGLERGQYALVTLHRPSNVDEEEALGAVVRLLLDVARIVPIVWPVHPRTRARLDTHRLLPTLEAAPGVRLVDPLGYRELVGTLEGSRLVITDSGGLQEEASYLRKPCITLRDTTERPVTVTLGTNTVAGRDTSRAMALVLDVLAGGYKAGGDIPGWDGRAAERVVAALSEAWG